MPIQERDVYYFSSTVLRGETEKPHYHAVIVRGELLSSGDSGIVAAVFSSYTEERYERLLRMYGEGTFVILGEDEYSCLDRKTLVDCNTVHILRPEEIDTSSRKEPISETVHQKIIDGIMRSRNVRGDIKKHLGRRWRQDILW